MRKLQAKGIDRRQWLGALYGKAAAHGRTAAHGNAPGCGSAGDARESVMEDMPESLHGDMLKKQLEQAERSLLEAAKPRGVYRVMSRDAVHTEGFSIEKHLEGCHLVILMAATLGAEVDALLRRVQISDMALAVIIDAGASVLIEQVCDDFEKAITRELAKSVRQVPQEKMAAEEASASLLHFTPRFSPGYGDYPLSEQKRVLQYLDAQRKIGLHVTRDSLMVPRKSVTALIGAAHHPVTGRTASCNECVLKEKCILRKEGKFCGDKL